MRNRRNSMRSRKSANFLICLAITIIVIAVVFVVRGRINTVKAENALVDKQIEQLNKDIEQEKKEQAELEEYGKYVNTIPFYEDVARNVYGLVYPDEKVLVSTDK